MKMRGELYQSTIKVVVDGHHILSAGSIDEAMMMTRGNVHGNYCEGKTVELKRGLKVLRTYVAKKGETK